MHNARDSYDVIIIGAGPAGLSCAAELQKSNKSVLLIEKNKVIGPKVCAGGITAKIDKMGISLKSTENTFLSAKISVCDKTVTVDVGDKPFVATIDRQEFGQMMLKKLSKKVSILTGVEVEKIGKNFVQANSRIINFKYIVGADGSNSIVRRSLGLKNEKFLIAIQYLVKKKYKDIEFFFDTKLFGSGYAWIFPHRDCTSIGCVQDIRFGKSKDLRNNFEIWLKSKNIKTGNSKLEGWTICFDYRGFMFDNHYLVGDAAGLASGLTGEGIYFAMISGIDVARKIINPEYRCTGIDNILKTKHQHENTLEATSFVIRCFGSWATPFFKICLLLAKNRFVARELIKKFG